MFFQHNKTGSPLIPKYSVLLLISTVWLPKIGFVTQTFLLVSSLRMVTLIFGIFFCLLRSLSERKVFESAVAVPWVYCIVFFYSVHVNSCTGPCVRCHAVKSMPVFFPLCKLKFSLKKKKYIVKSCIPVLFDMGILGCFSRSLGRVEDGITSYDNCC